MVPLAVLVYASIPTIVLPLWLFFSSKKRKTTRLLGPRSESFIFGVLALLSRASDRAAVFENWWDTYGSAYWIPSPLGTHRIVICDPKAIAHVLALDSWNYGDTPIKKWELRLIMGVDGMMCTLGDVHKRQRKIINPAFTASAVKSYMATFFDSADKIKNAWDRIVQSCPSGSAIIDVQDWMNRFALDNMGILCFSHDFQCLLGRPSAMWDILEEMGYLTQSRVAQAVLLVAESFSPLLKLPMPRPGLVAKLGREMHLVSDNLARKARSGEDSDKSALGLLLKAENVASKDTMTEAEVLSQMKVMLLAGYETTAGALAWTLIELSMHPEKQNRLRIELAQFYDIDPTYEQLTDDLPYLDAVVREVIRLHAPLRETTRVALKDDVIPLAHPTKTVSGSFVDRIVIAKGTSVTIPLDCVNRALSVWGTDGKDFVPERWLAEDGLPKLAKEYPGYHHTLSFLEGPRGCIGKGFALLEMKAALVVLIRNYILEPRYGSETKIVLGQRFAVRPKVAGEQGCGLPMVVRRVD